MNALKAVLREFVGLVVDDVGFAASVVAWIVLAWLISATVLQSGPWMAVMLFAGLGGILLEGALRRARAVR